VRLLRPGARYAKKIARFLLHHIPGVENRLQNILFRASRKRSGADHRIFFSLDSPSDQYYHFNDSITINGWAFSSVGQISLTVFIDGLEYRKLTVGVEREDIEKIFPEYDAARNCGFVQFLDLRHLPSGAHGLRLRISSTSGFSEEINWSKYFKQVINRNPA